MASLKLVTYCDSEGVWDWRYERAYARLFTFPDALYDTLSWQYKSYVTGGRYPAPMAVAEC